MFGNLKIPLEIEESVINSIKAHKYNGYGPSTGKSPGTSRDPLGKIPLEIEESVINIISKRVLEPAGKIPLEIEESL